MISSPSDLSRHFVPTKVLAAVGISVKGVTPEVAKCPLCKKDALSIYMDSSRSEGGRWLFCGACRFQGNTLDLLARLRNLTTVKAVVRQGVLEGLCDVPGEEITDDMIEHYTDNYTKHHAKVQNYWKVLRTNITSHEPKPDIIGRLQKENLWGGWSNLQATRITQFVGGGLRKDINALFGEDILPRTGFKTALVLGYQDVPGRVCAFNLRGEESDFFKFMVPNNVLANEGGLAMLDALDGIEGTIYAVNEPLLALQLHRKNFVDSTRPIKLVCYNDNTIRTWGSLGADRVILWTKALTWRTFVQARLIGRAWITTHPHMVNTDDPRSIHHYVFNDPTSHVLRVMEKFAKPWLEALVEWLLEPGRPDRDIYETLNQLTLDDKERSALLSSCPVSRRARLEHFLSAERSRKSVVIDKCNVVDDGAGWKVVHHTRAPEVICDVGIRLYREIHDTAAGKTYWQGELSYKGKLVEFVDDLEVIERNALRWLRERMARGSMGSPTVHPFWAGRFTYLIKSFNEPKVLEASTKLGLMDDGSIVLPTFKIKDGVVTDYHGYINPQSTPAMKLNKPVPRGVRPEDKHTPTRAAWMAAGCAMLANWIAVMQQLPPMSVGVIGQTGSVGQAAMRHLARTAGMNQFVIEQGLKQELDQLKSKFGYNYPSYVEPKNAGLLGDYPAHSSDGIFLGLDISEAAAISCSGNWMFINAPMLRADVELLPPFEDLLNYLVDLQKRRFELPDCTHLVDGVLADFSRWYTEYLGIDQEATFLAARKMLTSPVYPGNSIIDLFCCLKRSGRMNIEHRPLEWTELEGKGLTQRLGVVVDDGKDQVFLSKVSLLYCVRKARLPIPDLVAVTEDLVTRRLLIEINPHADGWVISKEHWTTYSGRWKTLNYTV